MWIIDVSEPTDPEVVGYYKYYGRDYCDNGVQAGIYAVGSYVYLPMGKYGLHILENQLIGVAEQACTFDIKTMMERGVVKFVIPQGYAVDISIYDVMGRKVANIKGENELIFRPKAGGVYFWVAETESGAKIKGKVVVLR